MSNLHTKNEQEPVRSKILQTASNLIVGQRQEDYGTPEENFQQIADFWSIHLKKILKEDTVLTPRLVSEMMILLKIARMSQSPTEDSYVDAAGYSAIAAELSNNEQQLKKATELKKCCISTNEESTEEFKN